jgi:ubiquinone/menaquinone biosynthesis C-methylase UbiE
MEIYADIKKIIGHVADQTEAGEFRIKGIKKYIDKIGPVEPKFYLDVGCFQGDITAALGGYFGLNKFQIHGIDIKQYELGKNADKFVSTVYDGKRIPYNDESFDLITCLMMFHHVPKENLDALLQEIHRVMKPGGLLIMREHNVSPRNYKLVGILNILHEYYDYVLNPTQCWEESKANYNSERFWADKLTQHRFVKQTTPKLSNDNPKNPFNKYIAGFRKKLTNHAPAHLFRTLTSATPRAKYYQREREIRNFIHWGQRKLLLSEIEFLTLFYKSYVSDRQVVAIYAGSAPGTHILYLAQLFDQVHFVLYDPRDFDKTLSGAKIEIHQEYFTDAVAAELAARFANDTILLISDIRTADVTEMDQAQVEVRVQEDHENQLRWYQILKPELSMFKFRLPWDDAVTTYLAGEIYIQPYAPLSSTETRLIVKSDAPMVEYNNREYEEQLFYFNKNMRDKPYKTNPTYSPEFDAAGLSNNYDGATEIYILWQYLIEYKEAEPSVDVIKAMSQEISARISDNRTLSGDQPLKAIKKELFKRAIAKGLAPNVHLTIKNYNLYILPIYERVLDATSGKH